MPDRIALEPALATLAEIANDNIAKAGDDHAERLRQIAAARVLAAARGLRAVAGGARPQAADPLVEALAADWDPRAVTALEYAESLPVPALDGFLRAAPRWASAMRDLIGRSEPGAAAA